MGKDCDEHKNNYFVGECIMCTFSEMRRFEALYHEGLAILRDQKYAGEAMAEADARADAFLDSDHQKLHMVSS